MEYRRFGDTYAVRLDKGEEIVAKIREFCLAENIELGSINGLGAANHAVIGLYDTSEKVFHSVTLDEPMEITSLTGNISTMDGENYLHIHMNVATADMKAHGGHLKECTISATAEIFITRLDGKVERRYDPDTGLNLYKFL